jgi:mannose-6-phosphate isomerase-like protein (cupin superfamily)
MFSKTTYVDIEPYRTKDGTIIREMMHPDKHSNKNQSIAEAVVSVGFTSHSHLHQISEEIYCIIEGKGLLTIGEDLVVVKEGDTILIPINTPHQIKNTGDCDLKVLCVCSPAYSHDDTILL